MTYDLDPETIRQGMAELVTIIRRKIDSGRLDEESGLAILTVEHLATGIGCMTAGHQDLGTELSQQAAGFACQHRVLRIAARANPVPDDLSGLGPDGKA